MQDTTKGSNSTAPGSLWFARNCRGWRERIKMPTLGILIVAQWKRTWLASMRTRVRSLAPLSGLRIHHCHVAVAAVEASSCRSNSNPSLGKSICHECSPKKQGKKKRTCHVNRMFVSGIIFLEQKMTIWKKPWNQLFSKINSSIILDITLCSENFTVPIF